MSIHLSSVCKRFNIKRLCNGLTLDSDVLVLRRIQSLYAASAHVVLRANDFFTIKEGNAFHRVARRVSWAPAVNTTFPVVPG